MLKGSRYGVLRRIQPVSIHGQVSWDVYYTNEEDRHGAVGMARVGPEAVDRHLEPGDRISLEFVLGAVTRVTRAAARTTADDTADDAS